VGNRAQRNSTVAALPPTGLLNYDANDRTATDPYDNNGNLLNAGIGSNVYDFENRLVKAGGVSIVYDGDGNRVSETIAGVTTSYLVADQNATGYAQVMDELQAGAVVRSYSYGLTLINERQVLNGIPAISFYGYDGHGSVRFLTDSTGAVTDTYTYDAFGTLISRHGATSNNYLFAGEQFDPALGVYYNRARYYDQRAARFWTMDIYEGTAAEPSSLHKYVYARNNPVDRIDPSGHQDLISTMEAEDISEELDAESAEADFAVKKALTAHVVDIYSCVKLQAYIIPIHCWVYANQPGNRGFRYDIGAEAAGRGPGLIIGSVSGYLLVSPTDLATVQADANLRFSKEASISELGFIEWSALIVAEFEFLGVVDDALKYATNYSFNTVTQDAVNCVTFTGFAIAAAKRIEASGH
jgi:RHS repeat-associated protein